MEFKKILGCIFVGLFFTVLGVNMLYAAPNKYSYSFVVYEVQGDPDLFMDDEYDPDDTTYLLDPSKDTLEPGKVYAVGLYLETDTSVSGNSSEGFQFGYFWDDEVLEPWTDSDGWTYVLADTSVESSGGMWPGGGKKGTTKVWAFSTIPDDMDYTLSDGMNMITNSIYDGTATTTFNGKGVMLWTLFKVRETTKTGSLPTGGKNVSFTFNDTLKYNSWTYGGGSFALDLNNVTFTIYEEEVLPSSDTTLNTLTVSNSGTNYILTPTFTAGSTDDTYSTVVPSGVTSIDIAATMTTPGSILPAGLGTKTLNVGDNSFTFTATAEDGTTKIYTINVKRLDNNIKLSTLTLSDISFTFNSDTNTYNLTAPYKTSSTTVSATLPAGSKATIDSGTGSWDLNTVGGVNTRKVVVKAEDCSYTTTQVPGVTCTTGEYTLNVTRSNPNNNATLSALNVDGTLVSGFNPNTLTYTLDATDKTSINITATATDSNATVTGTGSKTLSSGDNSFDIVVTAEDGTTKKTYTVNIRKKTSDAKLSSLTVTSTPQGTLRETFSPETYTYNYSYDATVTTINVAATASGSAKIKSGTGDYDTSTSSRATIVVEAEDGTTQNYVVYFNRNLSNDVRLGSLTVSDGTNTYPVTPTVADGVTEYSVTIPHDVTSVSVSATAKSNLSRVTSGTGNVNNIEFTSVSRTIIVTAEDNSTGSYTLNITREKSNNANLTGITVDGTPVSGFNKNTINYTLPDVNGNVNELTVTYTKENQYSSVVVTGDTLSDGNNQVKLTVTSQDGTETKVYTLNVRRKSSAARLQSLTVSSNPQGTIETFSPTKYTYNYSFDSSVSSINVSAVADGNATIKSGIGTYTNRDTKASIIVVAEDGTEVTYTVNFVRRLSSDTRLGSLTVSDGTNNYPVTPAVADGVTSYNVTIPHDVTSVTVSATAKNEFSSVTSGTGAVNNIAFTPVNRTIVIRAEDTSTGTYTLTITREKSSDADLTSIMLDGNPIVGFDKDTLEYTLLPVNSDVTTLNLTYTKSNQYANASIVAGTNNLVDGDNEVIIRVVSQDNSVTKDYKIKVKRKSSDATLSGLTITSSPQGSYTPTFNKATKEYTYKYDRTVTSVVINATVDGNKIVDGNGTYAIPDTTEVTLTVTAEDDNVKETYKIKFEQILESDSSLNSLVVKRGSETFNLTPAFSSTHKNYNLTVEGDVDEVEIEATPNGSHTQSVTGTGTVTLVSGGNTKEIVVTAEDGTKTTYTLNITRKINTSATVTDITIGGETIDGFDPSIATYDLGSVPYDTTTIDLGATPTAGASLSGDTGVQNLNVGDNTFEINVTAQDGVTTGKYTIKVRRKSNDYSLKDLSITSSPASTVRKDVNGDYTIDIPSQVERISITPIPNHESATVTNLSSLSNIDVSNITYIDIDVQAEDELYTGTHRVKINKLKSTNVYLSSLTIDQGTLTPVFNKETTSYTVNVGTEVDAITLTGVAEDSKSTVLGDGVKSLNPGDNTFVITVQAEDGVTTKDYTVVVTREQKSILTLSDLTIDGVTIDDFSSSKTTYTITVPYSKTDITIDATASDSDATLSGNGLGTHTLTNNSETFTFMVTAQDGSTQTYQVTVNKDNPDTDNTLGSLEVEGYPLSPAFDPDEENYTIGKVPETADSLTVNAIPGSDKSDVIYKVNGQEVTPSEDGKIDIPSDLGPGTIEVVVKAEDGSEKTYTITYNKTDGSDEGLDKITSVKMADGITDMHDIDDDYILTGRPETSWEDFKVEFLNEQNELFIFDNDGVNESTSEITRTGDMVKLIRDGVVLDTKYIIIKGDTNGDGKVKIADATRVVSHLMKTNVAEGAYLRALDVNDDGNVKIADATRVVSHLMKTNPFVYYKEISITN